MGLVMNTLIIIIVMLPNTISTKGTLKPNNSALYYDMIIIIIFMHVVIQALAGQGCIGRMLLFAYYYYYYYILLVLLVHVSIPSILFITI